jgi:hypothetical protein
MMEFLRHIGGDAMAVYFLRSTHISRSKGSRVTRAAAYRAGERIKDERTSEVYDHTGRDDVLHKEVVLPEDLAGRADMAWTQDRAILWNAAEYSGLRRNSRLAREWLMLLPPELTETQRVALVRAFAGHLAERYRAAVDVCIHAPRLTADSRNHHAHLLMTTREVSPEGFGRRTTLELSGRQRHQFGIGGSSYDEYIAIREQWALRVNEALQNAGLSVRVDHRSYERQGLDREPGPNIPEKVFYAERKANAQTPVGTEIRARHRERMAARARGPTQLAEVTAKQRDVLKARARQDLQREEAVPKKVRWGSLNRQERNALRRQQYQARRAQEKQDPIVEARRRAARLKEYHNRMQEDPESVRAARRRWRLARVDEINRKQREYRAKNRETLLEKRRVQRRARAMLETGKPQRPSASPSSQESVNRWKSYRQQHGAGPTANEAARHWRSVRAQEVAEASSAEPGDGKHRISHDEKTFGKPAKSHDPDFSL